MCALSPLAVASAESPGAHMQETEGLGRVAGTVEHALARVGGVTRPEVQPLRRC